MTCRDARAARETDGVPPQALVMRVDVDRSPAAAVTMAELFREHDCRATFFFRLSVMECVQAERATGGEHEIALDDPIGERDEVDFCWEWRMRDGLRILYYGLKGQ